MATKLNQLAGSRPKVYNLKDSDQLKDKTIVINKVDIKEGGEFGVFVVVTGKLHNASGVPSEEVIITTGATDVVTRLVPFANSINAGNEVEATFTKLGRKWLID